MKKTDHYQFNLIEKEDDFSPDPLNENTQKLEDQLDAVRAEAAEGDAALEQRVQVLELHKCVAGRYVGNGGTLTVELGFTPVAVITMMFGIPRFISTTFHYDKILKIVPGGFQVSVGGDTAATGANGEGGTYDFLALC